MGIAAVMIWSWYSDTRMPTWVWVFIVLEFILRLPQDIDGIQRLFG